MTFRGDKKLAMKKQDISRLRKNRTTFLQFGFIISLSLVILAFNWTTEITALKKANICVMEEIETVEIIRTPYDKKPVLPPPVIETSPVIEEIEPPDFTEEPILEPIEPTVSKKVKKVLPSETNFSTPKAPPIIKIEPEPEKEILFKIVEEMPRFPGCEEIGLSKSEKKLCAEKELLIFLGSHLRYPTVAKEFGYEGRVIIRFIIEKDGSISNMKILRDIGGGCGDEAVRVIKSMPNWLPGKQRGNPVRVQFNLPIQFQLR